MASAIKVVILGDGGVGKTTIVNKMRDSKYNMEQHMYNATMGVEVKPIKVGGVTINCWDIAGQEKFGGVHEGYYVGAHAAIIMFSVTERVTYKSVLKWYCDFMKVCGDKKVPIVLCATKANNPRRRIFPKDLTCDAIRHLNYFEIDNTVDSVMAPFQFIVQSLETK